MISAESQLLVLSGVPRVGKDFTTNEFVALDPSLRVLSTDDVRARLMWTNSTWEETANNDHAAGRSSNEQALFQLKIDNREYPDDDAWIRNVLERQLPDGTNYFIQRHMNEMHAIWNIADETGQSVLQREIHQAMTAQAAGKLLVQGVTILPQYAAELRETYPGMRALYLVNQSPQHVEDTLEAVAHAKATNPASNWMAAGNWSEKRIRQYMEPKFIIGEDRIREAEKYGFPWFDMSGNFYQNIARNIAYLMGDTVSHVPAGIASDITPPGRKSLRLSD